MGDKSTAPQQTVATDTDVAGEEQAAPRAACGQEFGSNAERIEWIQSHTKHLDERFRDEMNAGMPDPELAHLLMIHAGTGILKEFDRNEAWYELAASKWNPTQIAHWSSEMELVWEVDDIMSTTYKDSAVMQTEMAKWHDIAEDAMIEAAKKFAYKAEEGDEEVIEASALHSATVKAAFNQSFDEEFYLVWGTGGRVKCTEVDKGTLWSERKWLIDFDGQFDITRSAARHKIDSDIKATGELTTYTNDFAMVSTGTVDDIQWDEPAFF